MRSGRAKKRELKTDPIYKSRPIARTINKVMMGGNKKTAENIVYGALDKLSIDKKEAAAIFEDAIKNLMPQQEVRSRRVGGATYQIPYPVKHERSEALAIRWLIAAARKKEGSSMENRLFEEIKSAKEGTGDAIKFKEDIHKMAESNRAFAHFRF